ncbi:MAG TPA: BON domain-containing protein [Bryobacteraceae bacterium]|jgi:hyperosmotically inducible protein
MKRTFQTTIGFLGVAAMAAQLLAAPAPEAVRAPGSSGAFEQALPLTPAQKEVDRLFKQIASNAAVASRHADTLESFTRTGQRLQYESHAAELNGAKQAINAMGSDLRRLQELRSSALPWQQALIDRLEPTLAMTAGQATEAMERLNVDRRNMQSPEYRDAVLNLYATAGQARELISVNLDYAQAREKLNRLDASVLEPVEPVALEAPAASSNAASTAMTLEDRIRGELLKLPYYGVFDHLAFQVNGDRVVLNGHVSWPTLKTDAERAVRGVEGVEQVENSIEVLPVSPNDDRIRLAAYRAIYGHSMLARYRLNPHPPIRIIVENGNVTLKGTVSSDMDKAIAHMQANGVPGAFSVVNDLRVGG